METPKVDVLAVLDAEIHSIYQMAAWCAVECNPQKAVDAMVDARAAVAELMQKADVVATALSNLIAAGMVDAGYGQYVTDLTDALARIRSAS